VSAPPLSKAEQVKVLRRIAQLKPFQWRCRELDCDGQPHTSSNPLLTMPHRHARAAQLPPPGDWYFWFLMAGRGFGKTRTGAEFVKDRMMSEPGHRVAVICPDFAIGRDVCVEGESGLLGLEPNPGLFPPHVRKGIKWNRSIGELTLANGSMIKIFGTETRKDAESLRGYQCHTAWFEELGTQRYGDVAWDMLEFALRLGDDIRVVITGTPRPTKLIKRLVKDQDGVITTGSTYDNEHNLPAKMRDRIKRRHEGTTLGEQELFGRLLDDAVGALWNSEMFLRPEDATDLPDMVNIVIGVDPAGSAHKTSDLTGIVAVGLDAAGRLWVLADKSGRYSPEQWRTEVYALYDSLGADLVVGERNYGGDMVAATLRAVPMGERVLPFELVTASRGKVIRARPVADLYEQGRVLHVGTFADLEVDLTSWIPPGQFDEEGNPIEPSDWSPDRMDALVWAATKLGVRPRKPRTTSVFVAA
jgi:phage terminase large subunit-like protein